MDNTEKNTNIERPKSGQNPIQKAANGMTGGLVFGLILSVVCYKAYGILYAYPLGKIIVYAIGFFAFICFAVAVSCFFDWKTAKRKARLDEEAQKEEKEFSEIDPSKRALRAEKLFKMNQKELMRYYDINLVQTKFLSALGIGLIIFGALMAGISLIAYVSHESDKTLLFVGSISGIIVDFIGTLFIKMYTKNVSAAVKFHAKFAESNNLLLANSIANKIENETLREETLSAISKEIVSAKKT